MALKIRMPARPGSRAISCIKKLGHSASTDALKPYGTGFYYRAPDRSLFLITSWHVLSGRRPDDPGQLLPGYGFSPHSIDVSYHYRGVAGFGQVTVPLYRNGQPIWIQPAEDCSIDLAAIPISLPNDAEGIAINDFASEPRDVFLEPGLELMIVGYPFSPSPQHVYPIWKRGSLASEPGYLQNDVPQVYIDTPASPGMSGSPVYRASAGFQLPIGVDLPNRTAGGELFEFISQMSTSKLSETVVVDFVGVYAGTWGDKRLDELGLGRMFLAHFVDRMISDPHPGTNQYPPS